MKKDVFKHKAAAIAVYINTTVFFILSALHFYWAFGGKLWYDAVLPTTSKGLHRLHPGTPSGLVIGFGLFFFALVTLGNEGLWDRYVNRNYFRHGTLVIALLFILRAMGDFRFMGFFKIVKGTPFAINDTQLFSPLCLIIALLSLLIFICGRNVTAQCFFQRP